MHRGALLPQSTSGWVTVYRDVNPDSIVGEVNIRYPEPWKVHCKHRKTLLLLVAHVSTIEAAHSGFNVSLGVERERAPAKSRRGLSRAHSFIL